MSGVCLIYLYSNCVHKIYFFLTKRKSHSKNALIVRLESFIFLGEQDWSWTEFSLNISNTLLLRSNKHKVFYIAYNSKPKITFYFFTTSLALPYSV